MSRADGRTAKMKVTNSISFYFIMTGKKRAAAIRWLMEKKGGKRACRTQ